MTDFRWSVCEGGLHKANAARETMQNAEPNISRAEAQIAAAQSAAAQECSELDGRYDSVDDAIGEAIGNGRDQGEWLRDALDLSRCASEIADIARAENEKVMAEAAVDDAKASLEKALEDWKECLDEHAQPPRDHAAEAAEKTPLAPTEDGTTCDPDHRDPDMDPVCEEGVADPQALEDPEDAYCAPDDAPDVADGAGDGGLEPDGYDPDLMTGEACEPGMEDALFTDPDAGLDGGICEPPPDMGGGVP